MKTIIRSIVLNSLALYLMAQAFNGLTIIGGVTTTLFGGIALSLLSFFVKPILSVITFPFTLITFGAFKIVVNAILLLLVTFFIKQITISAFIFPGANFLGIILPRIAFNTFFAFLFLGLIYAALQWIWKWFLDEY